VRSSRKGVVVQTIRWQDQAMTDVVHDVCRRVRDAGGRAWLQGGGVRDALLGEVVHDADLEVHHLPADRLEAVLAAGYRLDCVGKVFAVLKLRDWPIDVGLPRRELKTGPGHRGFAVQSDPDLDLATAASRRDFTINAIYLDPLTGEIEDPLGGQADLAAGRLRHCSAAFAEDPLRVLRGMQLVARFDLEPDPATVVLCRGIGSDDLPVERIAGEWEKLLLLGTTPSRGLRFLEAVGWLAGYPELARLVGCLQPLEHHPEGDVWVHTGLCLDAFACERVGDRIEDLVVGLAVLCHDLGKPDTVEVVAGKVRTHGHQAAGVPIAERLLARLSHRHDLVPQVLPHVEWHNQPSALYAQRSGDAAVRRLARQVGRLDRLVRVARADVRGRGDLSAPFPAGEWLLARAASLGIAATAPTPLIQGRHLVALGVVPGPAFKPLLDACFEAQIEGVFAEEDGGVEYLRTLLSRSSS
jgi:tRNA nucleotidyltransferase (CCA-adding enzyme)